jgi:hypothetical protein
MRPPPAQGVPREAVALNPACTAGSPEPAVLR